MLNLENMYNDLAQYKDMLIAWFVFVLIVLLIASIYESYETKKKLKDKEQLIVKQRSIIGFYRTYMLTRYGRAFDEDEEIDKAETEEMGKVWLMNLNQLDRLESKK